MKILINKIEDVNFNNIDEQSFIIELLGLTVLDSFE